MRELPWMSMKSGLVVDRKSKALVIMMRKIHFEVKTNKQIPSNYFVFPVGGGGRLAHEKAILETFYLT